MDTNKIIKAGAIVLPILIAIFVDFLISIAILIIFSFVLLLTKRMQKKEFALAFVLFFTFSQLYYFYYTPSIYLAKNQGTVLSDNWFAALNWIKSNTPECTVVATYWDPGHFITGIGRRAVVFDGASQGDLYERPGAGPDGISVERYDSNINHIVLYKNGNKTTARIQDISTTLLTSNETLAVEILKEYRKPGCDSMYYIASSDLIGKSTWWTYFATWNPVDKKGTPYVYASVPLGQARPDIRQNAIIYTYPISQQESFIVYVTNNSMPVVFLQQQGNPEPLKVAKFLYFAEDGTGRLYTQTDAKIDGFVWIEPGNRAILFIPPQLENSLFTRMFLFNGQGLQNFEYVNNWGGEVKLYKVKFD